MDLILAFVVGLVVMDLIWAWSLGIPQLLWNRFKNRNRPQTDIDQEQS
jgi:hypothetical protein